MSSTTSRLGKSRRDAQNVAATPVPREPHKEVKENFLGHSQSCFQHLAEFCPAREVARELDRWRGVHMGRKCLDRL